MSYLYYLKESLGLEEFIAPVAPLEVIQVKSLAVKVSSVEMESGDKDLLVNILKALKYNIEDN